MSDQSHHPGPERRRRRSSARNATQPFFGNSILAREAYQSEQTSNSVQESLNPQRRRRRHAVSAAQGQTNIGLHLASDPSLSESHRQNSNESGPSPNLRSFKDRVLKLNIEEQRRLGYDAVGSDGSKLLKNAWRTTQKAEVDQSSPTFSTGTSSSATLCDDSPVREYVDLRRMHSAREPARIASVQQRTKQTSTNINNLRAFSVSDPKSAAAHLQKLKPSAAIKSVPSGKPVPVYSFGPEASAATAQIQTMSPSEELQQIHPALRPQAICDAQGREFNNVDNIGVLPPEILAAKTRVELMQSGEQYQTYLADLQLLKEFEYLYLNE